MKNIINVKNLKVIITTRKQLLLVSTMSALAISSISANAQLSIYGGNSESFSETQQSYNDSNYYVTSNNSYPSYATTNNYYSKSTSTYPEISSQVTSYQNNPYYYYNNNQNSELDELGGFIEKKASEYQYHTNTFNNAQASNYEGNSSFGNTFSKLSNTFTKGFNKFRNNSYNNRYYYSNFGSSFESWQNKYGNRGKVNAYRKYLVKHLGAHNVPPMSQLLQTAQSWRKCGGEPYSVPPVFYWHNMVPTLRLFATLKSQGIIPADTKITSVYRNSRLNRCAGGSGGSKHKINSALDLSSPSMKYSRYKLRRVQDDLCNFWLYQGEYYKFGLGLYSKGSIHIDTSKYRKWGNNYSSRSSPCRF